MRTGVIIQARMGSSRCPGKILEPILGVPMLEHQICRLREGGVSPVIVATTDHANDDATASLCEKLEVPVFRGSQDDVLDRYIQCAVQEGLDVVIRVGADDPLIDPDCIHLLIQAYKAKPRDFYYASHRKGWVYGTAAELVTLDALKRAHPLASGAEREHVVSFIRQSPEFSREPLFGRESEQRPDIFLSVDYAEDLDLVKQVLESFHAQKKVHSFKQSELIELYDSGKLKINNKNLHEGFED
jgi:spore coat polysaccharide biosynthesis protein SpsF